ncbi:hypothetical protein HYU13_03760 [Candidatus Woesearchaeota archaeon]|nr:hypothetical protein [Candidatus Woesearchaeota archaeon]
MLYGAPPAEVKEPHCCIQVKNIDWIDGKGYRVEGNKVFEFLVDRETLEPVQGTEQELPERLSPDGAFKIGGTVYGSRACEYHLEFQPMGFPSKLWRRTGARAVAYFFSGKTMEKELERSRRRYDEAQLLLTEKVAALERTEVALAKQVELSGQLQQVHGQLKEMYTTLEVRAKALAGELEAQRANIELASLVRGLGHHIKGPLGAVQSTLDGMGTVLKSLESAVSTDYLELLQGQMGIAISNAYEASRFIDIITRVVAAGKPGNIYAQPAGNYVRETLQPAVQSLRRDYPSIPFEESYSSTTPVGVNDQIKIALNHLMVNANEEMQRGNIIPAKPFRISVYDGDGGVYISVT